MLFDDVLFAMRFASMTVVVESSVIFPKRLASVLFVVGSTL